MDQVAGLGAWGDSPCTHHIPSSEESIVGIRCTPLLGNGGAFCTPLLGSRTPLLGKPPDSALYISEIGKDESLNPKNQRILGYGTDAREAGLWISKGCHGAQPGQGVGPRRARHARRKGGCAWLCAAPVPAPKSAALDQASAP